MFATSFCAFFHLLYNYRPYGLYSVFSTLECLRLHPFLRRLLPRSSRMGFSGSLISPNRLLATSSPSRLPDAVLVVGSCSMPTRVRLKYLPLLLSLSLLLLHPSIMKSLLPLLLTSLPSPLGPSPLLIYGVLVRAVSITTEAFVLMPASMLADYSPVSIQFPMSTIFICPTSRRTCRQSRRGRSVDDTEWGVA